MSGKATLYFMCGKMAAGKSIYARQLARDRNALLGSAWTSDAEFDLITAYFQPPAEDEHFNVVRLDRLGDS